MTQASKKFRQLKRKVHAWKASDKLKDSFPDKSKYYPLCPGTFKDCPDQIEDPKAPPKKCKTCPKYINSKFYTPPKRELPGFIRKMYGKKE